MCLHGIHSCIRCLLSACLTFTLWGLLWFPLWASFLWDVCNWTAGNESRREDLGFQQNEWTRWSLDNDLEEVKVEPYIPRALLSAQLAGEGSDSGVDSGTVGHGEWCGEKTNKKIRVVTLRPYCPCDWVRGINLPVKKLRHTTFEARSYCVTQVGSNL